MTSAGVAMAAAGRELIDAASAGDRLKARTLLRAGVSADVRSLDHAPLPIAVENSDLGMVVLLLSHGATPSLKPSPTSPSALEIARRIADGEHQIDSRATRRATRSGGAAVASETILSLLDPRDSNDALVGLRKALDLELDAQQQTERRRARRNGTFALVALALLVVLQQFGVFGDAEDVKEL